MKVIAYHKYGKPKVLKFEEVSKPLPQSDEVQIRVVATSVTQGDIRLRKADPFLARLFNGLLRPIKHNVLGFELAGIIEAVGLNVKSYKVGDEVFAFCGFGFGAYAEYKCLPVNGSTKIGYVRPKPHNMTFQEAATVPTGCLTAMTFMRDVQPGEEVLIYGASGSVGTFAVQIAKYKGAKVTAVCSTSNLKMVEKLGADRVIDYTIEDFSKESKRYDYVFDAVYKVSSRLCKSVLKDKGRYRNVKKASKILDNDLELIRQWIEAGHITTMIDRTYNWRDIQEAHAYVDEGHKKGNVSVVIFEGDGV